MNGLSLFANVGIAETYLYKNNIDIKVANELINKRGLIYNHNHPNTEMIVGDISDSIIFEQVMQSAKIHNCEFILATPPCQGMSSVGPRKKHDNRNQLITYVIKAIDILNPKYILIENVVQIEKTTIIIEGKKYKIIDYIKKHLKNYKVHYKALNTEDYKTPQTRKRMIFLISRKDVPEWSFKNLRKSELITVRDTISHLPSLEAGESSSIKYHKALIHNPNHILWMKHTPSGKTAIDNEIHFPQKDGRKIKAYRTSYKRMSWDKPAPTITTVSGAISSQNNVHPGHLLPDGTYSDARALSILELILLTGLPKKWSVPEWASDSVIRDVIGEAVPPMLIYELTKELKNVI